MCLTDIPGTRKTGSARISRLAGARVIGPFVETAFLTVCVCPPCLTSAGEVGGEVVSGR